MPHNYPNILLIQADQLKPQVLSSYGGFAVTPYLDQLADQGVVFENAYCNFPLCAPSRFAMLSGMLPSRIGAFDNGAEYLAQIPTVAHYLRLAGYRTCLSGKQHFVGPDMLHGFHERLVPELYPTDFSWTPSWDEVRMISNNNSSGVTRAGICARSVQMDHDEA
ncbi:MAG: sulfatase-like hydrolase/transferase, partial [Acidiferrobacteraceae bacterium]|nr:sulfatase-like hydrolase/transferase [Acidiferrobacteraceae bacterium]